MTRVRSHFGKRKKEVRTELLILQTKCMQQKSFDFLTEESHLNSDFSE
jgi:hypothetical protein